MRSAEEIYESIVQYERNDVSESLKRSILAAIIIAQDQAIEEALQQVEKYNTGKEPTPIVTAIINFIKQLKK